MNTKIEGSPFHHLTYVPTGWKRGHTMVTLLYPECEIQIVKADKKAGTLTTTIKGARDGDTIRGRISSFIDIARRERGAVMFVCDTEKQADVMVKVMKQAMPDMPRICPQGFVTSKKYGRGFQASVSLCTHDPDYGIKAAIYYATGRAA